MNDFSLSSHVMHQANGVCVCDKSDFVRLQQVEVYDDSNSFGVAEYRPLILPIPFNDVLIPGDALHYFLFLDLLFCFAYSYVSLSRLL